MESVYKAIGMDVLPDEYLPDDYTGPSAGPIQQIIRKRGPAINSLYDSHLSSAIVCCICHSSTESENLNWWKYFCSTCNGHSGIAIVLRKVRKCNCAIRS